ncbi:MAG: SDR family NAD(P)-dependent oxidoreductase [Gammaproteobacteria bacterium]|nr:SDR family NAD(P)-dependent oxidoreductase [Gammaproteobacteria bacterium]
MKEFEGKTAVVTGGASGIGRAMANRFAEARMQVVLADIEEEALEKAVGELKERQVNVLGVVTNTMRRESVNELLEKSVSEFGNIHILCNNAGVFARTETRAVWELDAADWEWVMGVNFWGVLYGVQAYVPHMLEHGEPAHIVNTASVAGLTPGGGPYGVSKHAVLALTEGLYRQLRERDANVGASVLCPGLVQTQIFAAERNRPDDLATQASQASAVPSALGAMLERGKPPEEIAEIVFAAIERDDLYILPHPAWDEMVRLRVEKILERHEPMNLRFDQLPPRDDGERY